VWHSSRDLCEFPCIAATAWRPAIL